MLRTIRKKLIGVGYSTALVIPKPIAILLNIEPGNEVELTVLNDQRLLVKVIVDKSKQSKIVKRDGNDGTISTEK